MQTQTRNNVDSGSGLQASGSSAWSRERQAQQIELTGAQHRRELRCYSKSMRHAGLVLRIFDTIVGLCLIIYGSLLLTQFKEPAMAAVIFCLILGSIILSGSLLGILSFSIRRYSRRIFAVSAIIAGYIFMVYITMIISLLLNSGGFYAYLENHKDVMYLKENVVDNCLRLRPLIYATLGLLSLLELLRLFIAVKEREKQILWDADALDDTLGYGTPPYATPLLTERLLNQNGSVGEGSAREITVRPDWWE